MPCISLVQAAIHDIAPNQVFCTTCHPFPVVRVETKRRLRKNERQARFGLHAESQAMIVVKKSRPSIGKRVVQVNVHSVEAAQRVGLGVACIHMFLKHVAGIVPALIVTLYCGD